MEERYIVSALKYRPQNFKSVVGQQALTATLKGAIANHHLAHAYLFCGPRGVGKTTCARIFAKTINCLNPGADGEACNECESCRAFNEQRSLNIHELDAASNNSVENIRSLVDQVRIPPQIGKYSVYIIDEVHMLSQAAFNAFLKTLEEPPAHAIFILATTEKHKIIPTILSRCQIYDFNRINTQDTVDYLTYVATDEGVAFEPRALNVIAQKADGAMRDALSIFDQVANFTNQNITYKAVIENLNVLDYDYYFRLVDCFLSGDVNQALLIFDEILRKGFEAQYFVSGLAAHLRDVMVSRDAVTLPLLEVGDAVAQQYKDQAQKCPLNFIYRALELSNECDLNYRQSRNKRLLVEILLIKLCSLLQEPRIEKKNVDELPPVKAVEPRTQPKTTQQPAPAAKPVQQHQSENPSTVNSKLQTTISASLPQRPSPVAEQVVSEPIKTGYQQSVTSKLSEAKSVGNADFSTLDLQNAWKAFAKTIEEEAHTYNTMLNFLPEKKGVHLASVALANNVQMDELTEIKHKIETFLSQTLKHDGIKLELFIDETISVNKAFTPEEKFAKMQEDNPVFKEFKDQLGLELM